MASSKALLPALDLGLLLVLLTFGTAGLTRLTAPQSSEDHDAPAVSAAESLASLTRRIAELSSDRDGLQRALDAARARADKLQRDLAQAQSRKMDLPALRKELQSTRERVDKLGREIARSKELLAELEKRKSKYAAEQSRVQGIRGELAELAKEIEDAQKKNRHLGTEVETRQEQLDATRSRTIVVDSTPLAKLATNRKPVYVALVQGTVAPLQQPYFRMEHEMLDLGNGRFEAEIKFVPSKTGEAVDEIVAEGSSLNQLLARVSPDRHYIVLLVDMTSFEAFRHVRDYLREHGVSFGWEPWQGGSVRLAPTGQMIPPQDDTAT